jgi:hypothetical protein
VNSRPILTVEKVQSWMPMSDDAACQIAKYLNARAFQTPFYANSLARNPSVLRMRRIHNALTVLSEDLPQYLEDMRQVLGKTSPEIESYLAQTIAMGSKFETKRVLAGRGRPPDRALEVSADLSRILEETVDGPLAKKQLDGLATQATEWLGVPGTDSSNKKRRTRSYKKRANP